MQKKLLHILFISLLSYWVTEEVCAQSVSHLMVTLPTVQITHSAHFPNTQNDDLLYSSEMELAEFSKLVIKNAKGNVQINGQSENRVLGIKVFQEVQVSLINRSDVDKAEVKVWSKDGEVHIETITQDYSRSNKYAPSYRIELNVPQNIKLYVDNQIGDVSVANLQSTFAIACSNGSISLENAFGNDRSRMKTVNGQINLTNFSGSMMCLVKQGNLNMQNVNAEIRARTYQGNIEGNALKGSYICEAKVGNIQLEIAQITKLVNLSSEVGNAILFANEKQNYELEMSGNDLKLVDQGRFTGSKTQNSISGKIGEGGPNIVLSAEVGQTLLILKSFD